MKVTSVYFRSLCERRRFFFDCFDFWIKDSPLGNQRRYANDGYNFHQSKSEETDAGKEGHGPGVDGTDDH